ncbi:MAG: hypothetical protein K6A36_05865 [Paludibacteraceae bacterium]|nr:hypothetical protein [Paludibacteraceae bacterium]
MDKKLQICATIKDGFAIGLANCLSLIAVTLLYVLTLWIPYLNVGTTIAMSSLPAELAKGKVINPLFIFDGKYRRNMGEFFILVTLITGAICVGFSFLIIPGLVISVAWNYAVVLFVDKDMNALDALRESNRITYGNKWRLFWTLFLAGLALGLISGCIGGLCALGGSVLEFIGYILVFCIVLLMVPVLLGIEASIYRQLASRKFLGYKEEAPKAQEAKAETKEAPKAEIKEAPKAEKKAEPKADKPKAQKKAAPKAAAKAPKADKPKAEKKAAPKAKKAPKAE